MPEGPEIRLAADRIAAALVGSPLTDVKLTPPALRRFRPKLVNANVLAVDTRGKAMLTRFDNGLTLYSHNQLYGRWFVTRAGKTPATQRSLRVALHTDEHSAWLYSASEIEVLDAAQIDSHPFLNRLGPDVLQAGLSVEEIRGRLEESRFHRRSLAALYLDQSFVAGIGNYLRSEILFTARLHPLLRPADLSRRQLTRLAKATLEISLRAYETRGVTVPPRLAKRLKKSGQRYGEYRHWVFARRDAACRVCGTPLEHLRYSSRSLFVCPNCQPRD